MSNSNLIINGKMGKIDNNSCFLKKYRKTEETEETESRAERERRRHERDRPPHARRCAVPEVREIRSRQAEGSAADLWN